jgi:hypothetical protein
VDLRLWAPNHGFWVDVRLRRLRGCWLAVADVAGDQEIGLGCASREAVAEALSCLGEQATIELLAGFERMRIDPA